MPFMKGNRLVLFRKKNLFVFLNIVRSTHVHSVCKIWISNFKIYYICTYPSALNILLEQPAEKVLTLQH